MKPLETGMPEVNTGRDQSSHFKLLKILFATIIFTAGSIAGYGQSNQNNYGNQQRTFTDKSLLQAIAGYNDNVRNNILIATQYPDVIEKAGQIRDHATSAFQQTIQDYPQKKQNWFYEVSRYPDLMDRLASMPRRSSKGEIEALLPANPADELREAAWKLYDSHQEDLVTVASLNQDAVISFQKLISPLGPTARNAFKSLEEMPDVLAFLNDHIDMAARLGERYQTDPEGVNQEVAQLHDQLNDPNNQDLSYRDELAQDPQAAAEFQRAQQDYASTGGNSYLPPNSNNNSMNYGSPYSYWFGYPSWYNYPMWYPGSFGYGSGIYLGFGGYSPFYGFPSLGFSRWFYGGAYRYYPNLYRRYDSIYRSRIARSYGGSRSPYMGSSGRYYNPRISGRSSGFNNNQTYRQGAAAPSQSYRTAPRNYSYGRSNSNSGSYSRPSYGAGASRSYGGSSFGGRSGGFSGGGSHGGGGGRGGRR